MIWIGIRKVLWYTLLCLKNSFMNNQEHLFMFKSIAVIWTWISYHFRFCIVEWWCSNVGSVLHNPFCNLHIMLELQICMEVLLFLVLLHHHALAWHWVCNFQPRKGCFEVRTGSGNTFISLLVNFYQYFASLV